VDVLNGTFSVCNEFYECTIIAANDPNAFLFIPSGARLTYTAGPNLNGDSALTFIVILIPSTGAQNLTVPFTINVLPINDPPDFAMYSSSGNSNGQVSIVSDVKDIDFLIGYNLSVTYTLVRTTGENLTSNGGNSSLKRNQNVEDTADGYFIIPDSSALGDVPPCTVSDDKKSINCNDLIEQVNPWLNSGINLVLGNGVMSAYIELNVNDLGNIGAGQDLNTSVFVVIDVPLGFIAGAAKPMSNNLAFILAPVAGLLAGLIIAGLLFAFRRRLANTQAASYFADYCTPGSDGSVNTSPIYEEATTGGESAIYKPPSE